MPEEYCQALISSLLVWALPQASALTLGGFLSPFHTAVQARGFSLPRRVTSCAIPVVAPQAFLAPLVPTHCFPSPTCGASLSWVQSSCLSSFLFSSLCPR